MPNNLKSDVRAKEISGRDWATSTRGGRSGRVALPATREPFLPSVTLNGFPGSRVVVMPRRAVWRALKSPATRELVPLAAAESAKPAGPLYEPVIGAGGVILLYCVEGHGWFESQGCRYSFAAGELALIAAEQPFDCGVEPGSRCQVSWAHTVGTKLDLFLGQFLNPGEGPVWTVGLDPRWPALFRELCDALQAGCTLVQMARAAETLAHLLSALAWGRSGRGNGEVEAAEKIEQSVAYMVQHLDKPLQVARLAALVNVSPSHFFALFKRHTGCAPIDFFIRLRMRYACRMLDTTSLNVKEVAAALGYEDPFYFSRVFKSVNRIAPSEYRALPRERMESIRKGGLSTGSLLHGNGREANHKAASLRFSADRAGKGIKNGAAIGSGLSPADSEAAYGPVLPEQHQNAYQTGKEMQHAKLNQHIASNDNRAIE